MSSCADDFAGFKFKFGNVEQWNFQLVFVRLIAFIVARE